MSITRSSVVADSVDEVFAWHARPGAFHRLSPGFAPMSLRSEAESIEDGEAVLVLPGGLTWTAAHQKSGYRPPNQFVDKLVSVPLRYLTPWTHTHEFAAVDAGHTRVTDHVETRVPGVALSSMFDFRHRQLADDMLTQKWARSLQPAPLTIGITGVSGTIGTALAALVTTGGHRVVSLVRRDPVGADERRWNPIHPAADLLDGLDVVIHLAGSSIAGRFTTAHVSRVRHSRVEPSRALARVAASAAADGRGPRVLVGASAIGFYGADRGDEVLTEASASGDGAIADIVRDWESAYTPAADAGMRVVAVRTGVVQASVGGMLKVLRPAFGAGLGGPIGDGSQWLSWIGLEDACDVFYRAALDQRLSGPVNAVSPEPVRNSEFAATMGSVMHRPAVLRVPDFAPNLVLTPSGAQSLVLASQRVLPETLTGVGHEFRMPELAATLRHQCGR